MTHPAVLTFREGSETFHVHADGSISRPAINMGPSGRWRFVGLANSRGVPLASFPYLVELLSHSESLRESLGTAKLHVQDLDCGTHRLHGAAIKPDDIHLIRRGSLAEVTRLDAERRAAEAAKRKADAAERLRMARKGGRTVGEWEGVTVRRNGTGYCVIDGDSAAIGLEMNEAAAMLGAALLDRAAA